MPADPISIYSKFPTANMCLQSFLNVKFTLDGDFPFRPVLQLPHSFNIQWVNDLIDPWIFSVKQVCLLLLEAFATSQLLFRSLDLCWVKSFALSQRLVTQCFPQIWDDLIHSCFILALVSHPSDVVVKEAWEVWEGWTGSGSLDSLRKQSK